MKQLGNLSNLTKVMFCVVAVLLVITVVLGIATAVKDGKKEEGKQNTEVSGTPIPVSGAPGTTTPGGNNPSAATHTPTPTPEATPTPEPTAPPQAGHKIAIDPGQQEKADNGKEAVGPGASTTVDKMSYGATSVTTKKREYEWTLTVSEQLKKELEARGYEVVMTRETGNVMISNAERAQFANESGADIYISIQADAASNTAASGIYAQIPSKTNGYVKNMYDDCKALAKAIQSELISSTGAKDRGLVEVDNVAAINWSKIPVTVLQLGFMSNKEEDTKLQSADYQAKLVKAICDGIDAYFAH